MLELTRDTLSNLPANRMSAFGMHRQAALASGVPGLIVSQDNFDITRHQLSDMIPYSVMEETTGQRQVWVKVPENGLQLQVVRHERGYQDAYGVMAAKRDAAANLAAGLQDIAPRFGDNIRQYVVGQPNQFFDDSTEVIETDGVPASDAHEISELCKRGLTLVLSDFMHLELDKVDDADFSKTVAIKLSHAIDHEYPAGMGKMPTFDGGQVNTNSPRKLRAFNDKLADFHRVQHIRMDQAGIALAEIVLWPLTGMRFDEAEADAKIAASLEQITGN